MALLTKKKETTTINIRFYRLLKERQQRKGKCIMLAITGGKLVTITQGILENGVILIDEG